MTPGPIRKRLILTTYRTLQALPTAFIAGFTTSLQWLNGGRGISIPYKQVLIRNSFSSKASRSPLAESLRSLQDFQVNNQGLQVFSKHNQPDIQAQGIISNPRSPVLYRNLLDFSPSQPASRAATFSSSNAHHHHPFLPYHPNFNSRMLNRTISSEDLHLKPIDSLVRLQVLC